MEDLYSFGEALPPKGEQIEIAHHLDEKLVGYRALENEAQSAITLLQERRHRQDRCAWAGSKPCQSWKWHDPPRNGVGVARACAPPPAMVTRLA